MLALDHADFLTLWEAGERLQTLDRGLLAIGASLPPDAQQSAVADWPLGQRNRALAALHSLYFGPRLEGWTVCPGCGETLEFELDCRVLDEAPSPPADQRVGMDGRTFRLPTSRDLASVAGEADPDQAALRLLQTCAIDPPGSAGQAEIALPPITSWPVDKVDAVAERMAEADPLAEISLGLECPLCRHASRETLDLGEFLWSEITARARRLLAEVHALASAYGWTEATILALGDARRALYLQMVQT